MKLPHRIQSLAATLRPESWFRRRPAAWLMALLPVLALTGCLETTFNPTVPGDVLAIDTGLDGTGDGHDGLADSATQTDTVDVHFDVAEVLADVEDSQDVTEVDAAPDVPEIAEDATSTDSGGDTSPLGLPTGHTCSVDSDCATSLCLSTGIGTKHCSEPCNGNCPEGTRCGIAPSSGSTTLHYCLPLPGDLCKKCTTDDQCQGGVCLTIEKTGESLCGLSCGEGTDGSCPTGFLCQSFVKGLQCVPVLDTCACKEPIQGDAWPCSLETPLGKCSGVQLCGTEGWSKCSATVPTAEQCDGLDNDCNGQTDEIFTTLGTPCGLGICAGGKHTCAADKKNYACSTDVKKLKKDLCGNGLDDDCNGLTDEACPPKDVDGDGTPDLKDCAPYQPEVHPGASEGCCTLLTAADTPAPVSVGDSTKTCDVNCDGQVIACSTLDKDGDGSEKPADCDDTKASIHPGAVEKCGDGVDQDCDGTDLKCDPTLDTDGDGWMTPEDCDDSDAKRYPGAPEACNYIDDDCDGVVDNGNPGGGAKCGQDLGACKPGTVVCKHVNLSASLTCTDASLGEPETCNGKDDNCDGATDEGFADLGAACDTDDADDCKNGKRTCSADGLGTTCAGEAVYDVAEQCKTGGGANGVDENCNGATDETCFAVAGDYDGDGVAGSADCNEYDAGFYPSHKDANGKDIAAPKEACCPPSIFASSQQLQLCDHNCDGVATVCDPTDLDFDGHTGADDCEGEKNPQQYVGAPEKCGDGIDQDCDLIDPPCDPAQDNDGDGYPNAVDCKPNDPSIHPFATEVCNNKDDDCNLLIDDGNPGAAAGACGLAIGQCLPGLEVCIHAGSPKVVCIAKQAPTAELCNLVDDNCNGKTDEYYTNLGEACDGADSDQCKNGTWTCAADFKGVVCANETIENLTELCDGLDNDCNGQTDEGLNYFGKKLGEKCKGQGACGDGTVVCSPELQVAVCSSDAYGSAPQASVEVCDGIDNDCDGFTDEGMLYGGGPLGSKCFGNGLCGKVAGSVECAKDTKVAICSTMLGGSNFQGKSETCNGIDDNCDGHVDEGLTVQDSTCKQAGVCNVDNVKASCKSGKWQCNYQGVGGYQGDKEVLCDGVDNDCDGGTDEDFQVGLGCDGTDTDQCKNGTFVCAADKLGSECGAETAADITELCNGKDDDCDGLTDEDFPVGQACDGQDSDQCKNGTWTCAPDGKSALCNNETVQDLTEQCNGVDDDCNGQTDETFADLESGCDGPDKDKCKNGVVICAPDGKSTQCGTETVTDIAEICDGVDNDCNGQIDEGQLYEGGKLGDSCKGIGACGQGNVVCSPIDKVATCSTNPNAYLIFDGKELCDGLDNDCNGIIDDSLSWKGIAKGQTCDAGGECGVGVVECAKDKQVTCSTLANGSTPKGKAEVCDGKDNDCDGQTDNGLTVKDSTCLKVGVCTSDKLAATCDGAKWSCDYSQVPNYQQTETLCDGVDNDCDGQTDEGFDIGLSCDGTDTDSCKTGTWSCSADASKHECLNESLTNIPEVCDGLDNDCNGQTDENFTYDGGALGAACKGLGQCGTGKVVCGKNLVATCSTNPDGAASQAKPEACDSLDNDCNGKTDDTLLYNGLPVGSFCSGVGECGLGTVVCANLKPVCSTNPDGPNNAAKAETCNSKDDDCNGQTDENLDPKKSTCTQVGVCAQALSAQCTAGKWQCNYVGFGFEPKETLCDDKDNDCNGVTDDPYPTKGKFCDGPDPDLCKGGTIVCDAGAKSASCVEPAGSSGPTTEICDGKDNDCNGLTDENFQDVGSACDGADSDFCSNGSWTCTGDGKSVQCVNEFIQNIVEICNGKDDDCDGVIDNGLGVGDPCDGPDSDKCKFGVFQCGDGGKVVCGTETKTNIIEACNNKDDDCDGVIDNGFPEVGTKCDGNIDGCAVGTYKCNPNGSGALSCLGDAGQVVGTSCKKSSSPTETDIWLCGTSASCSTTQGDKCDGKFCTCGSNSACAFGKQCVNGNCQ